MGCSNFEQFMRGSYQVQVEREVLPAKHRGNQLYQEHVKLLWFKLRHIILQKKTTALWI